MFEQDIKTYFISGHRDITDQEFAEHYIPKIDKGIQEGACFVIGDYYGVDQMAQDYLKDRGCGDLQVTVFHMLEKPRYCVWEYKCGGYESDEERDRGMTEVSTEDIAWVRPGKENSGTAQNLARRAIVKILTTVLDEHEHLFYRTRAFGSGSKFTSLLLDIDKHIMSEWEKVSKDYVSCKKPEKSVAIVSDIPEGIHPQHSRDFYEKHNNT